MKIIESEKAGRLKDARLLEADDGTTALKMLRRELSEGRKVDFVLMDYVMVSVSTCCMYVCTVCTTELSQRG